MMRNVSDIMFKNFQNINLLDGVKKAQDLVVNEGIDFFPVTCMNKIVGILTYRDLIRVNPNRIVADAMSDTIVSVCSSTSIWKAKELFDNNNIYALLIIDDNELVGIVTKTLLETELGKHLDLLTGLYKSDYIYYHIKKQITNNKNLSIVFIDVNNFGYIDKKYGHIQGDIVLKEIASILNENITSEIFLCRFGGDEFAILTPFNLDTCIEFTEKVLDKIAIFNFSNNIKITASAGITVHNDTSDCLNVDLMVYELVNRASLASTKAKKEKHSYCISDNNDKLYKIV